MRVARGATVRMDGFDICRLPVHTCHMACHARKFTANLRKRPAAATNIPRRLWAFRHVRSRFHALHTETSCTVNPPSQSVHARQSIYWRKVNSESVSRKQSARYFRLGTSQDAPLEQSSIPFKIQLVHPPDVLDVLRCNWRFTVKSR